MSKTNRKDNKSQATLADLSFADPTITVSDKYLWRERWVRLII